MKKQYMMGIVGPDGSGKSTLIELLRENSQTMLRSCPERIRIFHHRPHLLKNISHLFKKDISDQEIHELNFTPHSGRQSSMPVSFVKLLYYSCDYLFGFIIKVMPLQRNNAIIIFDRYFYDFIVDQKRSAIRLPESLTLMIYRFLIPAPNRVFFIEVDAEESHNRKKELQVEAIQSINESYGRLARRLDNFVVIENKDLSKAFAMFMKNIVMVMTVKIS